MKFIVTLIKQSTTMKQNQCSYRIQEDKQLLSLNIDLYALGDDAWIQTSICLDPHLN